MLLCPKILLAIALLTLSHRQNVIPNGRRLVLSVDAFCPTVSSFSSDRIERRLDSGLFMSSVPKEHSSSSTTGEAVAAAVKPPSFVSPMYQCYIEDTDSYGVMYNANYLRSFDRALHSFYAMGDDVIGDITSNKESSTTPRKSILDNHEDWAIVQVDQQKFKSSPPLGGGYCVHGTLIKHQDDDLEVWDLAMHETEDPRSTIYNSARVTIARPGIFGTPSKLLDDPLATLSTSPVTTTTTTTKDIFRLFRDEFDAHSSTHIPLRNVLTLFERSRSNFLGGPDALRKLKEEHGLLFVVTKINDCCKFAIADNNNNNNNSGAVRPGELVLVQTTFQVKRKGMIIDCQQVLKKASGQPVAQATVSLMTIEAETFKPSTNLPTWLRELLEGQ